MNAWHAGRALVAALLLAASGGAIAHKPSDAYLRLSPAADGRVEQRLDIALRDLNRELELDASGDGALTWGEVRRGWSRIVELADTAVVVGTDGQACRPLTAPAPLLDSHSDGRYAVLQRTLQCSAGDAPLTLDYRLFAASDPMHRGIVRLDLAGGAGATVTRVVVPGAAAERFALQTTSAARADAGFLGFFLNGLHHIAVGLDHLLFLMTLLMVAVWRRRGAGWEPQVEARLAWWEALRLVTAFTLAHSLTLGLAAAGVLAPPSRWVESLIAFSVVVAAIDNLRPFLPGPRWGVVAVFGLVHGIGFAGPLQDLGLRGEALAWPLLAFNFGVEAGQLIVVALVLPLAARVRAAPAYRRWVVRPGSALVALLALVWTAERALAIPLLPAGG